MTPDAHAPIKPDALAWIDNIMAPRYPAFAMTENTGGADSYRVYESGEPVQKMHTLPETQPTGEGSGAGVNPANDRMDWLSDYANVSDAVNTPTAGVVTSTHGAEIVGDKPLSDVDRIHVAQLTPARRTVWTWLHNNDHAVTHDMPSARDVAKATGISYETVRKVLPDYRARRELTQHR